MLEQTDREIFRCLSPVLAAIWLLSSTDYSLKLLITLPSKGDNSYPGLVWQHDTLYVSYYSDHIDNKTRVYLATLSGMNALLDEVEQG